MKVLVSVAAKASLTLLLLGKGKLTAALPPAWEVKADIVAKDGADFTPVLPDPDTGFGWSIAVSGDTLIAGSWPVEEDWVNGGCAVSTCQGSARVFVRTTNSNTGWEQQGDPLIVNDGNEGDYFGYRVAIDGDTALISATCLNSDTGLAKLFVFERTNNVWAQKKMLHVNTLGSSNIDSYDDGSPKRIALKGNIAVVGQPRNNDYYVYDTDSDSWTTDGTVFRHGKVFVYTRSSVDGSWSDDPQVLVADDKVDGDYFGDDVAISGDRILVGASGKDLFELDENGNCCDYNKPKDQKGKAYVFFKQGDGAWIQEGILYPDGDVTDPKFHFGSSVALDGDTALIGHDCDQYSGNCGFVWDEDSQQVVHSNLIVYGFSRSSGSWIQSIKLTPSSIDKNENQYHSWGFGRGVELKGNRALIEGGYYAILFENWQFVKSEQYSSSSNHRWWLSSARLALGSDAIFLGANHWRSVPGVNYEGMVNVIDNFSVLPFGPEEIILRWNYTMPTPYGPQLILDFLFGYGREFDFELMQKDCVTPISDTPTEFVSSGQGRESLTEYRYGFNTMFKPALLENNAIYNKMTGKVEVCAVARLVNSNVRYEKVFEIEHTFWTLFAFAHAWTNTNSIRAQYLAEKDQAVNLEAELLQKDCVTPIQDASIVSGLEYNSEMDESFNNVGFNFTLDPNTIRNSVIFNNVTSTIEVCIVAQLSGKIDKQILKFPLRAPGRFASLFGDPHIVTFDGLQFDCQAAGEFTTLTSLQDPIFKIQERFTAVVDTCGQASVSTGVAFRDSNKPTIQISVRRTEGASLNEVNTCPIDFYVDKVAYTFGHDLSAHNIEIIMNTDRISIKHTDTEVTLDVNIRHSDSFGCHIMAQVALPGSFRDGETLLGLLGAPNGDKTDDWRKPNGDVILAPTTDVERLFSTAYSYCTENWCVKQEEDSLFTYGNGTGETFPDIYKCDVDFLSDIEDSVKGLLDNPSSNTLLTDACGVSLVCLVDGLCGDIDDAVGALNNQNDIVETQVRLQADIFFDQEIVDTVTVSSTSRPTTAPSRSVTFGLFWYPAWGKGSKESVCFNDGEAESYMGISGLYFERSREACCERFFHWDKKTCLGDTAVTPAGFYPAWGSSTVKCLNSIAQIGKENSLPDYMMNNPRQWLYEDIESCCKRYYNWDLNNCIAESGGTSSVMFTEKWYVNQEKGICQQDCLEESSSPRCGGAVESWNALYETAEECCVRKLFWLPSLTCAQKSLLQTVTGTSKWYVDWVKSKCVKDCQGGNECGGLAAGHDTLYASVSDCCNRMSWVPSDTCAQQSLMQTVTGTNKWYVDWVKQKCVKDCQGGNECGELASKWDTLYASTDDCCKRIWWVDSSKCV